jgi:hypothetical protein
MKMDVKGDGDQEKEGGDRPDDFALKGLAILVVCFFKIKQ